MCVHTQTSSGRGALSDCSELISLCFQQKRPEQRRDEALPKESQFSYTGFPPGYYASVHSYFLTVHSVKDYTLVSRAHKKLIQYEEGEGVIPSLGDVSLFSRCEREVCGFPQGQEFLM